MSKLLSLITVLRHGSSLSDPAVHKNRQNLINALIGLMGALAIFLPIELSSENIADMAGGIAALVGLYNVYTTTATSDKVGLPTKHDDRQPEERIPDIPEWKPPYESTGG